MAYDHKNTRIEDTTAFRPAGEWLPDRRLDDHPRGRVGELVDVGQSRPGAMLPPHPARKAPTTTLAQRMRERFNKGG